MTFDRLHLAAVAAVVIVLCGCQFHQAPPPNIRVDVHPPAIELPRAPQALSAPAPRIIPPAAPAIADEPAPKDPPAVETTPIDFGPLGSIASLPIVMGPFNQGAAVTLEEPAVNREVQPLEPLPGEPEAPVENALAESVNTEPTAAIPALPPATNWHPLETLPALAGASATPIASPVALDEPAEEAAVVEAPPKKRGFPWLTIAALAVAVGAQFYPYLKKGVHGLESALQKRLPHGRAADPVGTAPHADSVGSPG